MRILLCVRAGALLLLSVALTAGLTPTGTIQEKKSPTVNVYTRNPVEFGKENELICHCSGFHPPRLTMKLKWDGKEYEDCKDSDLSFKEDWTYHRLKSTKFTPREGAEYSCEVIHDEGEPKNYRLEIY